MNSDSGSLFLVAALTQLSIWVVLWALQQRARMRVARWGVRFALMALGLTIALNLASWLTLQLPENVMLLALRDVLLVAMVVLVFALLLGVLVAVLSGAFRPTADTPDTSE
ncbi:MAG: hypothetical protein NZM28_01660 [Fimbriimonadales bacterium]|nr:hypothetical protein [Fimbriimonadales bacterium]